MGRHTAVGVPDRVYVPDGRLFLEDEGFMSSGCGSTALVASGPPGPSSSSVEYMVPFAVSSVSRPKAVMNSLALWER